MPTAFPNSGSPTAAASGQEIARGWRRAVIQIGVVLTTGLCVIALIWIIMFVVIETERQAALNHARADANNLSAAFQEEVGQTLNSVRHAMRTVAERMRSAQGGDIGEWNIEDWRADVPFLAAAKIEGSIIGPDGILLATTGDPHPPRTDLSGQDYFQAHLDSNERGIFFSKPVPGPVAGQTVLWMSRRVDAADGRFLGVIAFRLAPEKFATLHQLLELGPRDSLVLYGSEDNIVRARFGAGGERGLGPEGVLPPALNVANSGEPERFFVRESMIDHVTRLYDIKDVESYPLRVAVVLDLDDIVAPAAMHAHLVTAIGVLATAMVGGLMILLILEIRRRTDREAKLSDERARLAAEIQQGRLVQERLRASEARLRDFAEMASDWFWEQDEELRFTVITPDQPPFAGHQTMIGKRRWEVNDTSAEPEKWEKHKRDLLARKPFRDLRFSRPAADGSIQHVSITGVPVFDESGAFTGYRGTGRDITVRVRNEEEIRRSKEQAEAANRAKSAFLANMSHELRTPLNAIIGFAELIHARKSGRITEEYIEWAADIRASGMHLLDLINDVLELSRIEAGRHDLRDETVDVGAVTRACLPMIRRQAEKNRVQIACDIADEEAVLLADRRAIKQVMLNLLSNSVKFTPAGGRVSVRVERAPTGEMSLVVEDTGIGIDPAAIPNLCKPFIQADPSTSRRYGGTGLGLAISSKLMEMHGGSLTVASALGHGTTVRVNFPAARVITARTHTSETV